MLRSVEAIFTNGVLRPLENLGLAESQRVRITVEVVDDAVDMESRRVAMRALFERMDENAARFGRPLPTRDELHERG